MVPKPAIKKSCGVFPAKLIVPKSLHSIVSQPTDEEDQSAGKKHHVKIASESKVCKIVNVAFLNRQLRKERRK